MVKDKKYNNNNEERCSGSQKQERRKGGRDGYTARNMTRYLNMLERKAMNGP